MKCFRFFDALCLLLYFIFHYYLTKTIFWLQNNIFAVNQAGAQIPAPSWLCPSQAPAPVLAPAPSAGNSAKSHFSDPGRFSEHAMRVRLPASGGQGPADLAAGRRATGPDQPPLPPDQARRSRLGRVAAVPEAGL